MLETVSSENNHHLNLSHAANNRHVIIVVKQKITGSQPINPTSQLEHCAGT